MARGGSRQAFSDEDKARVLASLAANGGIVKRTAAECGVSPATVRKWRGQQEHGQGVAQALVDEAVDEFVEAAARVRNLALARLEDKINAGDVKASELVTIVGVLDDKVTRARGLPTSRVETSAALPDAQHLRELMSGFVEGAIRAAEQRHTDIIDAEVVAEIPR
jgi:transposase-like protein